MAYLQIVDLSPHLGHKLIAAAELKYDYIGLINDPGESVDGISTILFGLYDDKKIRTMENPRRAELVSQITKSKKRKGKTIALLSPQKKQKGPPPKGPVAGEEQSDAEGDDNVSRSHSE